MKHIFYTWEKNFECFFLRLLEKSLICYVKNKEDLLKLIKASVATTDPKAVLILYGSYARGDYRANSDVDLLILVDKEKIIRVDEKRIKYPLYDIEFETGTIISPLVFSKHEWETRHRTTPFYENIAREGKIL